MTTRTRKKTTSPTKPRVARVPKYKTKEGYFGIFSEGYTYKIGWYNTDDKDFGYTLANTDEDMALDADLRVAVGAAQDYFRECGRAIPNTYLDFCFIELQDAKRCLNTINAALLYWQQKRVMPEWATKALAEGWSPPKGWTF